MNGQQPGPSGLVNGQQPGPSGGGNGDRAEREPSQRATGNEVTQAGGGTTTATPPGTPTLTQMAQTWRAGVQEAEEDRKRREKYVGTQEQANLTNEEMKKKTKLYEKVPILLDTEKTTNYANRLKIWFRNVFQDQQ